MATTRTPKKRSAARPAIAPAARMTLDLAMRALEKAGSAQTRKTYARHGATGPMFGVSFAALKVLVKRIGVDHELARALWETRNFDAMLLAAKVADPARMSPRDLDRWAAEKRIRGCNMYVAALAAEGPHAAQKASQWLDSADETVRQTGWGLVGQMASRDEATEDSWFAALLARIERTIHGAPNFERYAMNSALIAIGGRTPALRKAALAAARRIGKVEVDHGDTACKTPEAGLYIEKAWAHARAKSFPSPAAQERARESPRTRC